jgi:hypothetical protein
LFGCEEKGNQSRTEDGLFIFDFSFLLFDLSSLRFESEELTTDGTVVFFRLLTFDSRLLAQLIAAV